MSWDEGLKTTVEWYKKHTDRYPNIEQALVPHPRAGGVVSSPADAVL